MHNKKHSRRKLTHRRSGKRLNLKQRTTGALNVFAGAASNNVAFFPITDEDILTMQRFLPRPRDCVINAMELLKIIDSNSAAIMRILVGDLGVFIPQIEGIFTYTYRRPFNFETHPISDFQVLINITNDLSVSNVIFVGVTYPTGPGHVFLIGKNTSGQLIQIDPQNPTLCDLSSEFCSRSVFGNAVSFGVLKYGDYPTLQPIGDAIVPMDTNSV